MKSDDTILKSQKEINRELTNIDSSINLAINNFYDAEKNKFKLILLPILIFFGMSFVEFIIGIIFDLPTILLISFFCLNMSVIAIFNDHWIVNSVVIPMMPIFIILTILDFLFINVLSFFVHVWIALFSLFVCVRKNTSFVVMCVSSVFYAMWVFTIKEWMLVPYYDCIFIFCNVYIQFFCVLICGFVISLLVTISNVRWKLKGNEIDCDNGICPI